MSQRIILSAFRSDALLFFRALSHVLHHLSSILYPLFPLWHLYLNLYTHLCFMTNSFIGTLDVCHVKPRNYAQNVDVLQSGT